VLRNLLDPCGPKAFLLTGLKGSAIALCVLALASSPALAASSIPASGGTISAHGGWNATTGLPDTCDSTEWLFVINGLSSNASKINPRGNVTYQAYPSSISVWFDNSTNVDIPQTAVQIFANPPSSTLHYSIPVDSTNSHYKLDGATATFSHSTDGNAMTYNNFVLSHGPCASGGTPPPPPPPPPPGATPELDSLLLFGSGATGLGGYVLMRLRSRKRHA